ncbi:DNA cytosine methyltransferase, partial [Pseudomonas aeruginosa]
MLSTQIRPAQPGLFTAQALGVDDFELSQITAEFSAISSGELEHHLFDAPRPSEIVRLADKVARHTRSHGWLDQAAAQARIAEWKRHAFAQGEGRANADKVVLSLFDHTGQWSQPWEDAGYQVLRFDIQDNPVTGDVNEFGAGFFGDWFGDFDGLDIYAILAACPCTEFATSGARHFAAKDADGRTVAAVQLVHQTLRTIEYFRPAVWAIENPVG